jgi:hypothetical protein
MPEERPMVRIPLRWVRLGMVVVLVLVVVVPGAALAAGSFDDDDNSMFEADIEWLAQTGITQGCSVSPPLFCPDRAVTRGQMAAFLHRFAQYLDSQGGTTAAQPIALYEGGFQPETVSNTPMRLRRLQFTPPADGTVIVDFAVQVSDSTGGSGAECGLTPFTTPDIGYSFGWLSGGASGATLGAIAGTRGFDVTGGNTMTVNLICQHIGNGADTSVFNAAMTLQYTPS